MEHQPQGAAAAVSVAVRKPRYERQVASDRREALVDATIQSLKRWGQEGLSVRRIAAEAGVSIGLINHHFPNKDTLVAESYRAFSRRLATNFEAAVAAAGPDPRARLKAYFNAFFSRPNLDPQVLTAWLVYWSRVQVSREMHAVHEEEGRGYGELLERLLADFAQERGRPQPDLELAVMGLTALLDGLWLKWCLDPASFRPKDAVSLCESWINRLASGSGPRTREPAGA